jgi:type I restriction enzyme R subunit
VNVPLLGFVADFLVPEHRLVIEFDGKVHKIPIVRDDDERRQAILEAAGYRVIRLTWRDITRFREQTRARILAATAT